MNKLYSNVATTVTGEKLHALDCEVSERDVTLCGRPIFDIKPQTFYPDWQSACRICSGIVLRGGRADA